MAGRRILIAVVVVVADHGIGGLRLEGLLQLLLEDLV